MEVTAKIVSRRESYVDSLTIQDKAALIEKKFKTMLNNRETVQKEEAALDIIWDISLYMAKYYDSPVWRHLNQLFIKHIEFLSELQSHQSEAFAVKFVQITKLFCSLCAKEKIHRHDMNQILDIWMKMMEQVDDKIKYKIFKCGENYFQGCVLFIYRVGCFSMQIKMLSILIGYVDMQYETARLLAAKLFHVIAGANVYQISRIMKQIADAPRQTIKDIHKRSVISEINILSPYLVTSATIQYMWFNDNIPVNLYPEHEAVLDFNRGTNTIEFCLYRDEQKFMAKIDKHALKCINVERSDSEYIQNMLINLKNPLHLEMVTESTVKSTILLRNIKIRLTFGILIYKFENFMEQMFPIGAYKFIEAPIVASSEIEMLCSQSEADENDDHNTAPIAMTTVSDVFESVFLDESNAQCVKDETEIEPNTSIADINTVEPLPNQTFDNIRYESSGSEDETNHISTTIEVKAQIHFDADGNRPNIVAPKLNRKIKKSAPVPDYDQIESIAFDEDHFEKKVVPKLVPELQSHALALPKKSSKNVSKSMVEAFYGQKRAEIDVKPVGSGIRRTTRTCAKKTNEVLAQLNKSTVYDFDDFCVPGTPKPKRKATARRTKAESNVIKLSLKGNKNPKPPLKRAATEETVEQPVIKAKQPRRLYSGHFYEFENDDIVSSDGKEEKLKLKKFTSIEDDRLTSSSFSSDDVDPVDHILKNLNKINMNEEAKRFDSLFAGPFFERGQENQNVSFSYRKHAKNEKTFGESSKANK